MMQPSNTPPDGDFVRYVDRLTAAQAVARNAAPAAMSGLSSVKAGLQPAVHIPFLRHLTWAVGLWVATQLLARFVPGAGFLLIPLLAVYAAWVIYRLKSQPPGTFLKDLAARARRAAEETRKPSSTFPNNKP